MMFAPIRSNVFLTIASSSYFSPPDPPPSLSMNAAVLYSQVWIFVPLSPSGLPGRALGPAMQPSRVMPASKKTLLMFADGSGWIGKRYPLAPPSADEQRRGRCPSNS